MDLISCPNDKRLADRIAELEAQLRTVKAAEEDRWRAAVDSVQRQREEERERHARAAEALNASVSREQAGRIEAEKARLEGERLFYGVAAEREQLRQQLADERERHEATIKAGIAVTRRAQSLEKRLDISVEGLRLIVETSNTDAYDGHLARRTYAAVLEAARVDEEQEPAGLGGDQEPQPAQVGSSSSSEPVCTCESPRAGLHASDCPSQEARHG